MEFRQREKSHQGGISIRHQATVVGEDVQGESSEENVKGDNGNSRKIESKQEHKVGNIEKKMATDQEPSPFKVKATQEPKENNGNSGKIESKQKPQEGNIEKKMATDQKLSKTKSKTRTLALKSQGPKEADRAPRPKNRSPKREKEEQKPKNK